MKVKLLIWTGGVLFQAAQIQPLILLIQFYSAQYGWVIVIWNIWKAGHQNRKLCVLNDVVITEALFKEAQSIETLMVISDFSWQFHLIVIYSKICSKSDNTDNRSKHVPL